MDNKLIVNTIQQMLDVQEENKWLDENFRSKIDKLTEEEAFRRPIHGIHSVAELISHVLEWRKESIRILNGSKPQLKIESPENRRTNDALKNEGWHNLKAEFYDSQKRIINILNNQTDQYLQKEYEYGCKYKYLIEGLIHHDLYHLGQIGITIKLL
jgi:uncharacterized damage-inducible protein DinB